MTCFVSDWKSTQQISRTAFGVQPLLAVVRRCSLAKLARPPANLRAALRAAADRDVFSALIITPSFLVSQNDGDSVDTGLQRAKNQPHERDWNH
jgi:hypothetical protein